MRVTIHQAESKGVIMKVEGKIAGPNVSTLLQAWEDLAPSLVERKLVVDLRGVTHVDTKGRDLLVSIHAKSGAGFLADTPLTKHFAEEAQQGIRTGSES